MGKRLPWGHQSRYCARCGKVGPRIFNPNKLEPGLYVHKYCMTKAERKAHNAQLKNATHPNWNIEE